MPNLTILEKVKKYGDRQAILIEQIECQAWRFGTENFSSIPHYSAKIGKFCQRRRKAEGGNNAKNKRGTRNYTYLWFEPAVCKKNLGTKRKRHSSRLRCSANASVSTEFFGNR